MAKSQKVKGTEEFILKPGNQHHGFDADGARHTFVGGEKDNDRVFLTPDQARAFKDKFESLEDADARTKAQNEVANLRNREAQIREKLADKGIDIEELLAAPTTPTTKKPDPSPSVGTPEPTPANVTPAPVGSTADPVNAKNTTSSPVPPKTDGDNKDGGKK